MSEVSQAAPHAGRRSRAWHRLARVRALLGCLVVLAALAGPVASGDEAAVQGDLLAGVRAFRAERYADALVIFRRLDAGGAVPEIGLYLGMTEHKLGHHAEALRGFRAARRADLHEPVATYYEAVSCYRLGLLQRARTLLRALLELRAYAGSADPAPVGPRLQAGARRFLLAIDEATASLPIATRAAAVLDHASALSRTRGRAAEAAEWFEEAALLTQRADQASYLPRLQQLARQIAEAGGAREADLLRTLTGGR